VSIRKNRLYRKEAKLAKIDLRRRAEIGRQRRAKSRAQIVEAARFLFTSRPISSVTIEDVTRQAQVAKGTFYSHFRSLDDLRAAVAEELSQTFEDLIDTSGLYAADPIARIAAGCAVFIGEAQRDPAWGALIVRGSCAFPTFASAARECLKTNLRLAQSEGRVASFSIEVGFDLVFGIILQAIRSASGARMSPADAKDVVQAILRALGVGTEEAVLALRRIYETTNVTRDSGSARTI
jgi:AcrR family transcriptional regulator